MPENLTPQNQWETEFQVPLPGEPRNIGPLKALFQRLLNRTERLKGRIADILGVAWDAPPPATISALNTRLANVEANQGAIPDGSVTTSKLADGAVTAQKLASGAVPYDLALYVAGAVQANATLLRLVAPRGIAIPTSGHQVRCAVAPAANWTATINKNGSSVGTISISAGQTTGSVSIASAVSLTTGDTLTIVAPSTADSSLRGLSVVLQGVT
jgi:hypothetical protein